MIKPKEDMTSRHAYHDSHPSVNASMEDFEARDFSPTMPDLPSQHSGFRSNGSEYSSRSSRRSQSPPAWRKAGSGWFKHPPSLSPTRRAFGSREPSPLYHSADEEDDTDMTAYRRATRLPLPASPEKGRSPDGSPEPNTPADAGGGDQEDGDTTLVDEQIKREIEAPVEMETPIQSNYIRFTGSLAVQQKTDNIEAVISYLRKFMHHAAKSRVNMVLYMIGSLLFYSLCANLLSTPVSGPVPDLVKVAGLAKSFEPVMYYSEAGNQQIGELQETGIAVWDLGESVRNTNMTSAPVIVRQLEDLSESLSELSTELTRFFVGLDGDVDAILQVMEWATRELTKISQPPVSTISTVWSNMHELLTRIGVVSPDSRIVKELVGQTIQQRTRGALERTFNEFLNVMEESINSELQYSMQLFALFEAIDKQFLNLHRTVIREQDQQERIESDFLSSLWTRVVGGNTSRLRKYEKNKSLLQTVRDRTVRNKHVLVDHNQRLLQMKSALEKLRQRLVSPLVRKTNTSSLSVEEQIQGLEGTYNQLKSVRDTQKSKKMALLFVTRERRDDLHSGAGIDGSTGLLG